jgi:hypothetical protein
MNVRQRARLTGALAACGARHWCVVMGVADENVVEVGRLNGATPDDRVVLSVWAATALDELVDHALDVVVDSGGVV